MSPEVSERSFEDAIECGLLQHGRTRAPVTAAGSAARQLRVSAVS